MNKPYSPLPLFGISLILALLSAFFFRDLMSTSFGQDKPAECHEEETIKNKGGTIMQCKTTCPKSGEVELCTALDLTPVSSVTQPKRF